MLESAWKLVLAGAGPGLQNQRAAIASRVGSTPTSFRQFNPSLSLVRRTMAVTHHRRDPYVQVLYYIVE